MLPLLPATALVVADAGYIGFELTKALLKHQVSFLIRQCSIINVYTEDQTPLETFRDGIVLYWPKEAQMRREAPLRLRLMCVRKRKKEAVSQSQDVWLLTNVVDAKHLSIEKAGQIYRWRWENEGLFRTFKRTLHKMTFESRTVKLLHREAEGTMLALQLLLAQGAMAMPRSAGKPTPQASPRRVLVEIRTEIQASLPRGRRVDFGRRLARASREQRERLTPKERRVWPNRAPHKPPKPP
jgi:Transposase DDE domain